MFVFSCISLHLGEVKHVVTCFFVVVVVVVVVHFSLMTTLFCFISLDTLLAFFVFVLSVYVCVFLDLSASWQGFLHRVTS